MRAGRWGMRSAAVHELREAAEEARRNERRVFKLEWLDGIDEEIARIEADIEEAHRRA